MSSLKGHTQGRPEQLKEQFIQLIDKHLQDLVDGPGNSHGAPLDDFCDKVFPQLIKKGATTVGYGPTENLIPQLSGKPVGDYFETSAARFPVERY